LNNQTMTFTPEQLRKQAQEMLRQAEQLEKTGVTKDAIRRDMVPALRELMQAKHRAQKAVDELVDCVAELETKVGKFEKMVQEVLR
jgi:nucleoside-triphosphatase THEP1